MNTGPDKCPFCESPIMVHVGNLLRSEDGGFATYKCKTVQDVRWDEKYIRDGQSDVCRILEVQLLTKQRDEARERIKRLEEAGDELQADKQTLLGLLHQMGAKPERLGGVGVGSTNRWINCKEAKP